MVKKCEVCGKSFGNGGALVRHVVICERVNDIKGVILSDYIDNHISIKKLSNKYNVSRTVINNILGDNVRSQSEASVLAHEKYKDSYKHTEETKMKLRDIRLKWMKDNPNNTAWRLSNQSYPEKIFDECMTKHGLNEKYSITREKSFYPYFIDFSFDDELIAIEIDGSQHLLPERAKSDKKKDKLLLDSGWLVIRFTALEVLRDVDRCVNEVMGIIKDRPKSNLLRFGVHKHTLIREVKKPMECNNRTKKQNESSINQRKVNRPPYVVLVNNIKELGFVGTGKVYGVSDNTIRKWIKWYESFN
jgi:very-short-patch-repair endonuclease